MEYEKKSFSMPVGSKKYRDNWDKIFGDGKVEEEEEEEKEEVKGWALHEVVGCYPVNHRVLNSKLSLEELKKQLGECGLFDCRWVSNKVNDGACGKCRYIESLIKKKGE